MAAQRCGQLVYSLSLISFLVTKGIMQSLASALSPLTSYVHERNRNEFNGRSLQSASISADVLEVFKGAASGISSGRCFLVRESANIQESWFFCHSFFFLVFFFFERNGGMTGRDKQQAYACSQSNAHCAERVHAQKERTTQK